jgi:hypothetical protein
MKSSWIMVQLLALLCCMAGVALHLYTVAFQAEGRFSFFLAGLFLWLCAPYAVALGLLLMAKKPVLAAGYAAASLGLDIFMFVSVFVRPSSSTAALGLLAMPFWNLVLFGPAGAFIAWLLLRIWPWKHAYVTKP